MPATLESACPQCGREAQRTALVCALCGHVLRRERRAERVPEPAPAIEPDVAAVEPEPRASREPWLYLALGLATAPVFALTPLVGFMGWFLAALAHEMGHAAAAWLCGMPAVPAISLAGHAAAVHGPQSAALALLVTAALATAAWRILAGRARAIALAVVVAGHPLLAFTSAKELLHLLAGHGAELLFAALCLWKTLDGGFTRSRLERVLYGTLGWFLVGTNVRLCLGLIRSGVDRARYRSNGSFGLTNDYVRVAEDVLGWRLEGVAGLMLVAGLLVVPLALGLWRLGRRSVDGG